MPASSHSRFSPSSAYRWLNCGKSVQIYKSLPAQEPSKASIEGTKYHDMIERYLRKYGFYYFREENTFALGYAQFLVHSKFPKNKISKNLYSQLCKVAQFIEKKKGSIISLGIESRVTINSVLQGCFGTCDLLIYYGVKDKTHLIVLDFKFGAIAIEPDSPQLILYSLGALECASRKVDSVTTCVVQPKLSEEPNFKKYTLKQIEKIKQSYIKKVKDLANRKYTAKVGSWCEYYSRCRMVCDAYKEKRMEELTQSFAEYQIGA